MSVTLRLLLPGEVEAESEEEDDDDDDCKKGSMDEVRVELPANSITLQIQYIVCHVLRLPSSGPMRQCSPCCINGISGGTDEDVLVLFCFAF